MSPRWNILDHPFLRWYYPELQVCRTQFERMEAAARGRSDSAALTARIIIPIIGFVAFMLGVPAVYLWARPYWLPMWSMAAVMGPAVPLFIYLMMMAAREQQRRGVRRFLIDRGIALCSSCGYDLRGQDAAAERCPECGERIDDQVRQLISVPQSSAPAQ